MAISKKPRHWIAIIFAVIGLVIAIIAGLDFSGEPPPRWREISMVVLWPIVMGSLIFNMIKDKEAGK